MMNLMEKLETRFDEKIVFPDKLVQEAYNEIKRLREALFRIANSKYNGRTAVMIAHRALMKLTDVQKQENKS